MMEELAAYASMGAASVALDAGLLFNTDEESYRSHVSNEPTIFHKKLTSLKRRNDDEDDMTISLLATVWEDELVACIADSSVSKKPAPVSVSKSDSGALVYGNRNASTFGEHSLFQNARDFAGGVLGKRKKLTNWMTFANGFRPSDAGIERNASDEGIQQTDLVSQQTTSRSLQNSMFSRHRELIDQIRRTNEQLENQFRFQSGLDLRVPEENAETQVQDEERQPH